MNPEFHVFLCHNTLDKPAVKHIADHLETMGLKPWLDIRELRPGTPWQRALEQQIKTNDVVAIFIGPAGMGPWQTLEMDAFFRESIKRDCRIIPVLLQGEKTPQLPPLLEDLTWVDFRATEPHPLAQLYWGITGKHYSEEPPDVKLPKTPEPFRVLLLSTDQDLQEHRQNTARYLTSVHKAVVTQSNGGDGVHVEDHHLTILLQGCLWEDGACARILEKAEHRIIFQIDDEAKWPHRALVDFHALDAISTFCLKHSPVLFQDPEDLPMLVAEEAAKLQKKIMGHGQDGLDAGLKEYLNSRLKVWTDGRTNIGSAYQTHLQVYQPSLYIGLKATAGQWQWDPEQGLTRFKREKDLQEKSTEPLVKPLAWWVSRPELPWLALCGSPGGGKTISLTRMAATLAQYLLTGQSSLEPDLDPSGLRPSGGPPPIPVVLEATRLAKIPHNNLSDLARVVAQELTVSNSGEPSSLSDLEDDLKAGRFLLLVDALDEIPEQIKRANTLQFLKMLRECLGETRLVITTRSARYTGHMNFEPELEEVKVQALDQDQINALCELFCNIRNQDVSFKTQLMEAVAVLERRAGKDEANLVGNPLLLSTVCNLFHSKRRLPKDMAELCHLLIDDLCRIRITHNQERGWSLEPNDKRDMLEHLAFEMQCDGAQTWPIGGAEDVVAQLLSTEQARDAGYKKRCLEWLVEHTGLVYFRSSDAGEIVRFQHRLFREFLAASHLAGLDKTADALAAYMYEQGFLTQDFWFDVIPFLPRAMVKPERATALADSLLELAKKHEKDRGRLLALLAAILVESLGLFKKFKMEPFKQYAVETYEKEGAAWAKQDRITFLTALGELGDPRMDPFHQDYWVPIQPGSFIMGEDDFEDGGKPQHQVTLTQPYSMARFTVTNALFKQFMKDKGYENEAWWGEDGWRWLNMDEQEIKAWLKEQELSKSSAQFYRPAREPRLWRNRIFNGSNQPVVGVNWLEANAWCRWFSHQLRTHRPTWLPEGDIQVTLPTEAQWEFAARGDAQRPYPWGDSKPHGELACYHPSGHTTPCGAFPAGVTPHGIADMAGNAWEWCRDIWDDKAYQKRADGATDPVGLGGSLRVLRGGSWFGSAGNLRASCRFTDRVWDRDRNFGFRCCLLCGCGSEHD